MNFCWSQIAIVYKGMDKAPSLTHHAGRSIMGTQTQSHGALLMRYHSAPSSVLATLHSDDVLCDTVSAHVEDSDLARVCMPNALSNVQNAADNGHGYIRAYNLHASHDLPSSMPQGPIAMRASLRPQCADLNELGTSGHPCSIFKRTQIDPRSNFQSSVQNTEDSATTTELSPKLAMPAPLSSVSQPLLPTKSSLIRHSSFPAEILSRLGVENSNEGPMQQFTGSSVRHDNMRASTAAEGLPYDKGRLEADMLNDSVRAALIPHDSTRDAHGSPHNNSNGRVALKNKGWLESNRPLLAKGSSFNGKTPIFQATDKIKVTAGEMWSMESSLSLDQSSLFRQSSLPARLLSQLSFDGSCVPSSSGNSSEEGGPRFTSNVSGFWDEAGAGVGVLGQRKRGREAEDKAANKCAKDSTQRCSVEEEILQWNFGGHSDLSSGSLPSLDDSVLCRVRAKRGCATHPRSIAERVRRTKISEGMRKLQELVPNMEKQTNTATMLDEAVEYVKFLQQQVQKLSESQSKCNGTCHSKSNT